MKGSSATRVLSRTFTRVLDCSRKVASAPSATPTEAAVGALNDAGGRKARRDLDARVLAPHVFLSLRREQGEVPVVNAEDREDPAARPADCGDLHDGTVERAGIELEAFIALRLDAAKESGRLEVLERLVGESPQLFGMHGALAERRQQRTDTGEIIVGSQRILGVVMATSTAW